MPGVAREYSRSIMLIKTLKDFVILTYTLRSFFTFR